MTVCVCICDCVMTWRPRPVHVSRYSIETLALSHPSCRQYPSPRPRQAPLSSLTTNQCRDANLITSNKLIQVHVAVYCSDVVCQTMHDATIALLGRSHHSCMLGCNRKKTGFNKCRFDTYIMEIARGKKM